MRAAPLSLLLGTRLRCMRNVLANLHRESLLKVVVVTILGVLFWFSLFFLFNESFRFLNAVAGPFRDHLVKHIFGLFFLTLLVMLVFSNALISFSNLFRSPETAFLFTLPVRHDTIYLYKLVEALIFSSWALFALGLPLLISYGLRSDVSWFYYPAMLVLLLPFVTLPAALGSFLGLALTALVPRHRGKFLAMAALAVLLGIGWYGVGLLRLQAGISHLGASGDTPAYVQLILGKLEFTQHPMMPNYWITHALLGVAHGSEQGLRDGAVFLVALTTSALFFLVLGWFVAGVLYESTYSTAVSVGNARRIKRRWWIEVLAAPLQKRWPSVTVLVLKDIKTFLRDPVQWSQVLIFFGLLTVYIANLRNFTYPIDRPFYNNLISFLNLGATCLTLATMVSRFVFPLISLEGRRFWVLGLVPVERRRILVAKYVFSLGGALVLTEMLVLLSNYILQSSPIMLVLQLVTAGMLCVGLTGMAVGMGALFPALRESNPSKIVSGFGGTLTLILSISLVILVVAAEAIFCHQHIGKVLDANDPESQVYRFMLVGLLGAVGLVTFLAAYIPLTLGARALDQMEF